MFGWLGRFWEKKLPLKEVEVIFEDRTIVCRRPNGTSEEVTWEELQAIEIMTTDTGPFVEDVFWILHGDGRGCVIPQEAAGLRELLPRLQKLPGFDNKMLISAMSCTDNAKFPVWERSRVQLGDE